MIQLNKIKDLENSLKYKFKNKNLIIMALTHKSYAYEKENKIEYNERIEFLGDAILEHIISDMLYNYVPKISEGEMTKKRADIVCEASLASALKRINGENYILLGKCEKKANDVVEDAIIADAFEAILGAIYIDGGYDEAKKFVLRMLDNEIKLVLSGKSLNIDYKTNLQEILQKNGNVKIKYNVLEESGPDHNKQFRVEVTFNGKRIGEGIGKSKKNAEQQAAKQAIEGRKYNS